jgi:hypothetical protein
MDVSLMTMASSLEDFKVIIKVLFQSMEISMPADQKDLSPLEFQLLPWQWPLSTHRITQLGAEITS